MYKIMAWGVSSNIQRSFIIAAPHSGSDVINLQRIDRCDGNELRVKSSQESQTDLYYKNPDKTLADIGSEGYHFEQTGLDEIKSDLDVVYYAQPEDDIEIAVTGLKPEFAAWMKTVNTYIGKPENKTGTLLNIRA